MNSWNILKLGYKEYFSDPEYFETIEENGVTLIKSKINSYYFNFCMINKNIGDFQKNIFLNNVDSPTFVLGMPGLKENINSFSKNLNFIGTGSIMRNVVLKKQYFPKIDNNMKTIIVEKKSKSFEDFCYIAAETKNLDFNLMKNVFNKIVENNNIKMFVCYFDNEPSGILSAAVFQNYVVSVDSGIKENVRNSGVLTSMAEEAISHGINLGIKDYYCLVSSPYTYKVVKKQGYDNDMICELFVGNG